MGLTFDQYDVAAAKTAIYPRENAIPYLIMGLTGEAGEVANKYKKVIRDQNSYLEMDDIDAIVDELGDVLWYVSRLARELGASLHDVAAINNLKLETRKAKGTLGGSGDTR